MYYYYKDNMSENIYLIEDLFIRIIPIGVNNSDYKKYLDWIDEGNTPLTWPPNEGGV